MAYVFKVASIRAELATLMDMENMGQKTNREVVLELMLRVAFLPNRDGFEEREVILQLLNDNFCDRIQNKTFCVEFLHRCETIIYELRKSGEYFSDARNRIVYLFLDKDTAILGIKQ